MTLDLRADVTCSLGPLISGSFADDYLQNNGLIKTRGEVLINGTINPVVGTPVTFTYTKNGTTRPIPRTLRVLSSFADPFRRTTTVQLGCKLTYYSNRKTIERNPNVKDEHPDIPCKVFGKATIPLSAAFIYQLCLDALGLTSDAVTLTNVFSQEEFDLSPGYIQVISDLLQSEGYAGYLDSSEVLRIIDLSVETGEGRLITPEDIIDLGPIGVGDLPGESVVVRYNSQELVPPDDEFDDEYLKRSWEVEEQFGAQSEVTVSYTNDQGDPETDLDYFFPYQFSATRYDVWDRKIESINLTVVSAAEINNRWASDAFKVGRAWNIPVGRLTREVIEYVTPAQAVNDVNLMVINEVGGGATRVKELLAEFAAGQDHPADECIYEPSDDADQVKSQTTTSMFSELELAGSLNIDTYISEGSSGLGSSLIEFNTVPWLTESVVTVEYETDDASGISKTITKRTISRSQTVSGQQDLATKAQGLDYASLATSISSLLNDAAKIVYTGADVSLHYQRQYGLQKRPSEADRTKTANSKGPATEEEAQLAWIFGSTTSTAVTEFTMPYQPDDQITYTEGAGFGISRSDAPQKALKYGRIQNRLLLGNRNGVSLQLAPETMPPRPFDPLYLEANGLTGAFRVNGTSWAFDSNGIVCSVDALLWGAVSSIPGTDPNDYWLKLPPDAPTLPEPEDPTTNPDGDPVLDPPVIFPPYNETVYLIGRTITTAAVEDYGYSLDTEEVEVTLITRTDLTIGAVLSAGPATFILTGQDAASTTTFAISAGAGSFAVSGYSAGNVRDFGMAANAGTFNLSGQGANLLLGRSNLLAGPGTFLVSGQDSTYTKGAILQAGAGVFTLSGQATSFSSNYILSADAGAITTTGQAADLRAVVPQVALTSFVGNGTTTNAITGTGFRPGMVWVKRTNATTQAHYIFFELFNPIEAGGSSYALSTNGGGAASTGGSFMTFDSDGFTLKSSTGNSNGANYWAMCWKEGNAATTNNDGSITTTVSVNSDLGYSQFKYAPTGSDGTIGHGLGSTPELVLLFVVGYTGGYVMGGSVIGDNYYMVHNSTAARASSTSRYQGFSSTTISIGSDVSVNRSGAAWAVGYAFVSVPGTSKIGSFTGDGNGTQAITGVGFSPRFVMVKSYNGGTSSWVMFTAGRDGRLLANSTAGEASPDYITFDSDGFTLESGAGVNSSGVDYLYMALA